MKLTQKSVAALLEDFRSSAPTPGGGSAAALAGAIGASLLAMVAALPKPRATSDEELQKLRIAGERCAALATELEDLVDRDSAAYELVMAAYRLPKASDEEKAQRAAAIQQALKSAIAAPLDVMRACRSGAESGQVARRFGNANAASDVEVGLELLGAGLRGARLNVEINLGSVKDSGYVEDVRREIQQLSESGAAAAPSASS
jgi:formiminotetrahydrofolate cyclodeaminase